MGISVVCDHLYKKYKGNDYYSLYNVNFSVKMNGILSVIGRNGAGKTTLIRILATQLLPSQGTAMIDGYDVINDANKLREEIAALPQEGDLIPWLTIYENIFAYLLWRGFSISSASERAKEMLKLFGIEQYANILPDKLSGGTKRKALVAQVLASDARIVFLDEPSVGLDPLSRRELWKILKQMKKNKLIILTTHYLEEAEKLSDKVAVIDKGKVIAIGTIPALREKIGYSFVIKVKGHPNIENVNGIEVRGEKYTQIYLSKEDAKKLSKRFLRENREFFISPISLDDVFVFLIENKYKL
jgi:ABC-2 type transport system ATP-binding protein